MGLMEIFDCIEKTVSPQYFPDFTLLENVQNRNPQIKRSTCAEQYLQCFGTPSAILPRGNKLSFRDPSAINPPTTFA